jgi:hypothetical protein
MALLASASVSLAADCVSDPNECTLKKLCEASTTLDGNNTIWATTSETAKHVALAQSLGMECGVTPIVDLCETDPSECKVSEICEKATTESAGQKTWDDSAAGHVALAKEYGLSCDVVVEAAVKKTCWATMPAGCTDSDLCRYATGGTGKWQSLHHQGYVTEAKKRGLSCGVETAAAQVKSKDVCNLTNQKACNNEKTLCHLATNRGTWEARSVFKQYSKEAKKRGLTCGVGETKEAKAKTPSSIVLEASKRVCPGNGIGKNCTGVYTNKEGNKWIGRRVNRYLYGVVTYLSLEDDKWKGDVRIGQRNNISNKWSGQNLYVWRSGQARFDFDVPKGTYNSNSTVNEVFPQLRRMFNALPKQQRLKIQRSLAKKDLYASTIDGAWGRNTLIGLSRFAAEHLNTINLKSKSNISLVLDGLIAQASLTRTKMAPLNVLEEVAKKDAGFTRVASNSSSMKNAYIGETALRRKQIQYALKKLGFYTSGVDGLWGGGTASALVGYQNEEGLQSSTPSQVFRRILSEVDVPSSFAAPKKKATASNNSGGWRPFSANPQYSFNQAKAICEPQAEMAGEQASSSYSSPNYGSSANCTGYGYSINCNVRENSGGFWGGVAEGIGKGFARRDAARAVLKSCMAKYGWTK